MSVSTHPGSGTGPTATGGPGIVKVVFASTRQVYGRPETLPVTEQHLVRPTDVNGINKAAGEYYHLVYNNVFGVRACALRLTNVYGPRQLLRHNRQGFIGWFLRQALLGEPIQVFGDGRQRRDFNHVDDVVDALLRAGASDAADGQAFNLGGGAPASLEELAKLLVELAGRGSYTLVPFPPERKKIDIGDFYGDIGKIRAALGWQPRIGLREGLASTLAFYREHEEHYL